MTLRRLWVAVAATWVGVLLAVDVGLPLLLGAAAVAGLVGRGRLVVLPILLLLVASQISAWNIAGLSPVPAQTFAGEVRLLTDPEPLGAAMRVDIATSLGELQVRATGRVADDVRDLLAGDRMRVVGDVSPRGADDDWLLSRRVVGLLAPDRIDGVRRATGVRAWANQLRLTLERGGESLGDERRSLFTGLVVGDDRWQSPQTTDAFRGSGLGHLLAVSGQNVAFVLLVFTPLLRWLPPGGRLVVTFGLLGFFALVTRFEPSVLRASVMAALAVAGMIVGRPSAGLSVLGASALGLLLWDPLLGRTVGFQLSVLASLGILVIGPRVAVRVPGSASLGLAVGATVGAQCAVAPLLLWVFDDVPVAALPANMLAAPAAGPVMAWGLTGGLVAGLVGGSVASVLQVPTGWWLGWSAGVAEWASTAGWGSYRWVHVMVLALLLVAGVVGGRRFGWVVAAVAVVALVSPMFGGQAATGVSDPARGVRVWRDGGATVVEVEADARGEAVLAGLRTERVGQVDLLVVDKAPPAAVEAIVARYRPAAAVDLGEPASLRSQFQIGDLWVRFTSSNRGVQTLVDRREAPHG